MPKTLARSKPPKAAGSRCADPAKPIDIRKRQANQKLEFAFRTLCLKATVAVVALAMIPCLCWLFLAYNRPEFLERILTIVACVAGGYGWARWNSRSGGERNT